LPAFMRNSLLTRAARRHVRRKPVDPIVLAGGSDRTTLYELIAMKHLAVGVE